MDFDEDTAVDYGIELGDLVLVETESSLLVGVFTALTEAGFHVRVTHEMETVQDELSVDAKDAIRELVFGLGAFELLALAHGLKLGLWSYRTQYRLAEAVSEVMIERHRPAPRKVLKARSHFIRRIIPEHTLVTMDLYEDWDHNVTLADLDFEVEFDEDEETSTPVE